VAKRFWEVNGLEEETIMTPQKSAVANGLSRRTLLTGGAALGAAALIGLPNQGQARNLLLQSDMYMTDVAIACGFGSSSHFSKRFRGHFGYSPYQLCNRQGDPNIAVGTDVLDAAWKDSQAGSCFTGAQELCKPCYFR
jgi:AraC-like DNA-binding protein